MASGCIIEVHSVSSFPLHPTVEIETAFKHSLPEPSPTPTEVALTEEEFNAFLLKWDADIRRAARSAAMRFQLDESYADDFAQEARIRLFNVVRRQPSLPETYLRSVISNAIQTAVTATRLPYEHDSIDKVTNEPEMATQTLTAESDALKIAGVAAFIRTLPTNLRTVYALLYEQGHTQREAALQLGVAQPRVAQLHRELLTRARRELVHLHDGEDFLAA